MTLFINALKPFRYAHNFSCIASCSNSCIGYMNSLRAYLKSLRAFMCHNLSHYHILIVLKLETCFYTNFRTCENTFQSVYLYIFIRFFAVKFTSCRRSHLSTGFQEHFCRIYQCQMSMWIVGM